MCLGIPGRILAFPADQPDLGHVDVDGVTRAINLSLLADDPPILGEWVLIHLGFALQKMTLAEVEEMNATRDLLFMGVAAPVDPIAAHAATTAPLREPGS
jgi:hydrogenase expression/formation protein HypC